VRHTKSEVYNPRRSHDNFTFVHVIDRSGRVSVPPFGKFDLWMSFYVPKLPDLNQSASHLPTQARFAVSAVKSARYCSSLNAIPESKRGCVPQRNLSGVLVALLLLKPTAILRYRRKGARQEAVFDAAFPILVSLTPSRTTSSARTVNNCHC
jgi:hypothetical protein